MALLDARVEHAQALGQFFDKGLLLLVVVARGGRVMVCGLVLFLTDGGLQSRVAQVQEGRARVANLLRLRPGFDKDDL